MPRLTARSAMSTLRPVPTVTVVALLICLSVLCGASHDILPTSNCHPNDSEGASGVHPTCIESATNLHPTVVTMRDNRGLLMTMRDNDDTAEGGRGPPARASASAAVRRAAL